MTVLPQGGRKRVAVSTPVIVGIIIVIVVVASGGGYFVYRSTLAPSVPANVASYVSSLPGYYPSNYSQIIEKAMGETKLVIYDSFAASSFNPVVQAFEQKYPWITVENINMPSATTLTRYQAEESAGKPTADIIFDNSPSLNYQVAVNDSLAMRYCSPEQQFYPTDLNVKCLVFSPLISAQVFLVNTKLVPANMIPTGYADLASEVKANASFWSGKVGGYEFSVAVTGLLPTYSSVYGEKTVLGWFSTYKQYSGYQQYTSAVLSGGLVASGQLYVTIGALALLAPIQQQSGGTTKLVFPSEGTYAYPGLMFITKAAANRYAAMLFVDYFLSAEGQTVQMNAYYASARTDLPAEASPWTYANIVNLAGGANKIIFETEPPSYNSTYSTSVDQAFATLMSS